jgi:hypothetical protein
MIALASAASALPLCFNVPDPLVGQGCAFLLDQDRLPKAGVYATGARIDEAESYLRLRLPPWLNLCGGHGT